MYILWRADIATSRASVKYKKNHTQILIKFEQVVSIWYHYQDGIQCFYFPYHVLICMQKSSNGEINSRLLALSENCNYFSHFTYQFLSEMHKLFAILLCSKTQLHVELLRNVTDKSLAMILLFCGSCIASLVRPICVQENLTNITIATCFTACMFTTN